MIVVGIALRHIVKCNIHTSWRSFFIRSIFKLRFCPLILFCQGLFWLLLSTYCISGVPFRIHLISFPAPLKRPTHFRAGNLCHFHKSLSTPVHRRPREQNCEVLDATGTCRSGLWYVKKYSNCILMNSKWGSRKPEMLEGAFFIFEGI